MIIPPNQKAPDEAGGQAAAPSKEVSRDVFSPAPDIQVGPFTVRRFVDGDFMALAALGHPLDSLGALERQAYVFEPSGPLAWQLCWIMTRPRAEVKEVFRTKAIAGVKEAAEDMFGELPLVAIGNVMKGIAQQIGIYGGGDLSSVRSSPATETTAGES